MEFRSSSVPLCISLILCGGKVSFSGTDGKEAVTSAAAGSADDFGTCRNHSAEGRKTLNKIAKTLATMLRIGMGDEIDYDWG